LSAAEPQQGGPSEEELRAAYEAELSRLTSTDVIAQAAVSLLNIGARRLAPPGGDREPDAAAQQQAGQRAGQGQPEDQGDRGPTHPQRDLAQARDAIDAVRTLLEILERSIPQEVAPLRDALSRLQMAYAREVAAGAPASATPATAGQTGAPAATPQGAPAAGDGQGDRASEPGGEEPPKGPGPAEASGRLWVPGR
jgi:hypothetical protein